MELSNFTRKRHALAGLLCNASSHSLQLLRNATRAIHTRATKCVEVGGDTFENLL